MFMSCTSLETAPELPAETLVEGCYDTMFSNCTSLKNITMLAKDISAADAKVKTLVIPTNEELMIALDTKDLISK